MPKPVSLPPGDPLYSVYIWRQDSQTLARMRPFLEEFVALADTACERHQPPNNCITPRDEQQEPCWPCRLKLLRTRLYSITNRGRATT